MNVKQNVVKLFIVVNLFETFRGKVTAAKYNPRLSNCTQNITLWQPPGHNKNLPNFVVLPETKRDESLVFLHCTQFMWVQIRMWKEKLLN